MTNDDAAWLEKYYADWDSGDLDAITSWFDEEVVLEDVPTGHVARGAQEARTFVSGALKMAPGASYEVISVLADGDRFAAAVQGIAGKRLTYKQLTGNMEDRIAADDGNDAASDGFLN